MTFARPDPNTHLDTLPQLPVWVTNARVETPEDVAFLSGAVLSHLHLLLKREDVPQSLLRNRLALCTAEIWMTHQGRPERASDLRDALAFLQPGDSPGPAGEVYGAWRRATQKPISVKAMHRALPDVEAEPIATWLDTGQGPPVSRAAAVAEAIIADRPRDPGSALILADAVLAFLFALAAVGWLADRYFDRPGFWSFIGAIYIGLGLCLFIFLRETPEQGLGAVVWLALVVIATDIGAYFAGRLIGGPKLWPRVSPGKTWSGAVGGVAAAVFVAALFRIGAGETPTGLSALAAAVLSAVSQGGDLAESAYKRKFGVKDSGRILPGHGGLLDRLDGLLAATIVLGMIALTRPNDPVWAW